MELLKQEKGIALVTALMLTLITLTITMVTIYLVLQNTKMSGAQKTYKNSLDASLGGVEIMTKDAIPYLLQATDSLVGLQPSIANYYKDKLILSMPGLDASSVSVASDICLNAKLTKRQNEWGPYCAAESTDLDATKSPDISFILKSAIPGAVSSSGFRVSAKIISTTVGNSDLSGRELSLNTSSTTGVSDAGGGVGSPYIYRLEVIGERESNPKERAALTVLYAY
jgi:hypothetical protein